ncbi:hypothetical protein, partial [Sansalvadorimonas verongulae]|uniref:hypothetical protein n=1 Tax=Sansalvadorimonas verongulae TaxID=2172824 RepID=UPI0012BC64F4
MSQLFSHMNPEKVAALTETLGISLENIIQSVQSGTALPASTASALKLHNIIRKLWGGKSDIHAFVLGCELLKSKDEPDISECSLLGSRATSTSQLVLVVDGLVRSAQPVDSVIQELQGLHEKMVQSGLVSHSNWQYTIIRILTEVARPPGSCLPQFIAAAQVAIQQNWLEPEYCPDDRAEALYDLLKKLDAVNELKPLVQRLLKNWYAHFLGKTIDKGSIRWMLGTASPFALPMCSGHSPILEASLKINNLAPSWTGEPEGVPDIGRL